MLKLSILSWSWCINLFCLLLASSNLNIFSLCDIADSHIKCKQSSRLAEAGLGSSVRFGRSWVRESSSGAAGRREGWGAGLLLPAGWVVLLWFVPVHRVRDSS